MCCEQSQKFAGILNEFYLDSFVGDTYPNGAPAPDHLQKLSIHRSGQVCFRSFRLTSSHQLHENCCRIFSIAESSAAEILDHLSEYFSLPRLQLAFLDCTYWDADLINSRGEHTAFHGSCLYDNDTELKSLSRLIRKKLNMEMLYVFDPSPSTLQTITVRIIKNQSNSTDAFHKEEMVIDRQSVTIHQDQGGNGNAVYSYHIPEKTAVFLDHKDTDCFIASLKKSHTHTLPLSDSYFSYEITVDTSASNHTYTGIFDRQDLTAPFFSWIRQIQNLLGPFAPAVLSPSVFEESYLREKQYIVCDVSPYPDYTDADPACYFLTDDRTIAPGDSVLISIGTQGLQVNGTVLNCLHVYPEDMDIDILSLPSIQGKSADPEILWAYDLLGIEGYPSVKSSLMYRNLYDGEIAAYYAACINAIEFLNGLNEAQKIYAHFEGSMEEWVELKELYAARIFNEFAVDGQSQQETVQKFMEQIGYQFYKGFWISI